MRRCILRKPEGVGPPDGVTRRYRKDNPICNGGSVIRPKSEIQEDLLRKARKAYPHYF